MHDNPKAFTIAWDRYVALHCKPHEITAAQQYPSDFPACEDEDICMLCALQWENIPNFNAQPHKCECCEMPDEEILIPDLSIFIPNTPNGSQDEHRNQHLWSYTANTSKLQMCLTPDERSSSSS
jgi:hypothetical protein